jgi:uncharacterized membrane protein YqjE
MTGIGPSRGLFASLRQLLDSGLELAQVRLRLLGNELEEEKLRLTAAALLACLGLMLLAIGLLLACALIVLSFDPAHRLKVLAVLCLLFAGGGGWLLLGSIRRLRSPGGLFQSSLAEIAQDRAALEP